MKKKKPQKNKNKTGLQRMLLRQPAVFAVYAFALLLTGGVCFAAGVNRHSLSIISLCVMCAAALLCGFFAGRREQKNGLLSGFLTCLLPHLVLLMVSLWVNGFSFDWTAVLSFVMLSLCAMLGGIFAVNLQPRAARKARKGRFV